MPRPCTVRDFLSNPGTPLDNATFLQSIPRLRTDDIPSPDQDLATEVEMGTEIGITEAGLVLDTVANTRAGGADPVRIAQVVLDHPGGEITGTKTAGVVTTEGGQDPTAGHAPPEGTGTEDMPQTRRNSWVMTTLLRSSSELLLWKSGVEVKITRLR